jgi:protein arginine kinase activator
MQQKNSAGRRFKELREVITLLCQRCHERSASLHFTKIVNGGKSEIHLCEKCAKEQGDFLIPNGQPFDFTQLLSGFLNMASLNSSQAQNPSTALRCDVCGMTYHQFTKIGRFGCPSCYTSFASRLEALLRRIQSSTSHTGKIPVRAGEQVKIRKGLEKLRKELEQAVLLEQFERAAELRDQIRLMERKIQDK